MAHENLELREWLAVNLMGLANVERGVSVPDGYGNSEFHPSVGGHRLIERAESDEEWYEVPPYESTWDGMGMIVEAMRARGFCVTIEYGPGESSVCYATFSRAEPRRYGHTRALPAPMAVALAARAALEGGK